MNTRKSIPLKIKLLNLAAEIRIIRGEEKRIEGYINKLSIRTDVEKSLKDLRIGSHYSDLTEIRQHRYYVVKTEARDTLLAYGFLRGRAYKQIEAKRYYDPNWDNIERMILKYGRQNPQQLKQAFEQWKQEAGEVASKNEIKSSPYPDDYKVTVISQPSLKKISIVKRIFG